MYTVCIYIYIYIEISNWLFWKPAFSLIQNLPSRFWLYENGVKTQPNFGRTPLGCKHHWSSFHLRFCSNCPCFVEITVCFLFRFPPGDLKRKQREKTSKPRGFEQRGKAKAKKTGDFLGGCEQKGLLHVHSFASNFTYLNAQEALFPRPNPLFPKSFFPIP